MPKRIKARPEFTLYQRHEDGPWWFDFRVAGQRHRRSTDRFVREEAEAVARGALAKAREDAAERTRAAGPGRGAPPDLARLATYDLKRAAAEGVTAAQLASIEACWLHLARGLGATLPADAVDYDLVEGYVAQRRQAGARGQSIRKEVQALRRGLVIARRKKQLAVVPELPAVRSDPPDPHKRGKLHPPEVLLAWLEALRGVPRSQGAAAHADLVLRTGLRAEEAARLSWSWVEAAPDGVPVPALLRVPAWAAKTRQERVLGLPETSLALLQEARGGRGPDEPLFSCGHRNAFRAAQRAIGYPQRITLRDLRHCHATWSAQRTGDASAAQAALGHADLATTQRYLSATLSRVVSAAVAVDTLLASSPQDGHTAWSHAEAPSSKTGVERVGVTGLEPATLCSQSTAQAIVDHISRCSTCLSRLLDVVSMCPAAPQCGHTDGHTATRVAG